MRIFGPRRSRTAKAASLRASSSWLGRLTDALSDVEVVLRLLVAVAGIAALALVLQGWRRPFGYRLGELLPDGIQARIEFSRVNDRKTESVHLEAEKNAPDVYLHDPSRPRELLYLFREHLFAVATAETPAELSGEVATGFGLSNADANGNAAARLSNAGWETLKEAVGSADGAERRIDELVQDLTRLLGPINRSGVLAPNELSRRDRRVDERVQVINSEQPDEPQEHVIGDLLLTEMLKPAGRIGRDWKSHPRLEKLQPLLEQWLIRRVKPTLVFDSPRTEQARAVARRETPSVKDEFSQGAVLAPPGTRVTPDLFEILVAQHQTLERQMSWADRLLRLGSMIGLLVVLAVVQGVYLVRNEPRLVGHLGRLLVYVSLIVLAVGLGSVWSLDPWRAEVIPLLTVVMTLSVAYNQVLAAFTGFTVALLLTVATGGQVHDFAVLIAAMAAAVLQLSQIASRSKLLVVGFSTAAVYFLVSMAWAILETPNLVSLWRDTTAIQSALWGAFYCVMAGYFVGGSLPFIESAFGVVTDISLLELGQVSHPLLQELVRRAPGTYNHSISVATISETAADSIQANGLLCRVGAYFHDIGKMLKPQYFVENMASGGSSRHENLAPAMSTLIIIGHVKDGVDLARQHSLPQPLVDFIEQHHGTTLVEYFYHQATRQAESQRDQKIEVEESSFRYPGPKPQSREAGVLMLADAVESASRALSDPTPKRIEGLVHDLTMKRLLDGQFEESSLTLSEISTIEASLTKSLISIYHGRIKYPEQRTA